MVYPFLCIDLPMISSTSDCSRTMGAMPFCMQLLRNMSAKLGAIIALNPISFRAQGACSRDDPDPKLRPATSIDASAYLGSFRTNSGFGTPSSRYRQSKKANSPKPVRSIRFKNCFGII